MSKFLIFPSAQMFPVLNKGGRGSSSDQDWGLLLKQLIWNNKKVTTGDPPFYEKFMKIPRILSQNSSESSIFLVVFTVFTWRSLDIFASPPTNYFHPHDNPMITPWHSNPQKKNDEGLTGEVQIPRHLHLRRRRRLHVAEKMLSLDHQWKSSWNRGRFFTVPPLKKLYQVFNSIIYFRGTIIFFRNI